MADKDNDREKILDELAKQAQEIGGYDIPHKDEDQDGIPDDVETKVGERKTSHDLRLFSDLPSFGYRFKKKAKKVLRVVTRSPIFQVAKEFLPKPIEIGMDILMKSLKRAFTKEGGSWLRLRDEDGKITKEALIAAGLRLGAITLLYFLGQWLGIDISGLLATLGLAS